MQILRKNRSTKEEYEPSTRGGSMIRKPDHCGRCAAQDRRRSKKIRRETGRYACVECSKLDDSQAAQVRENRVGVLELHEEDLADVEDAASKGGAGAM